MKEPTTKIKFSRRFKKRTSIGSGKPLNKHKRRQWKKYNRQGTR